MIVLAEKFIFGLGEVSLGASFLLILIFALLPFIRKKYRAKWCYLLWLALAIRLIIPFNIHIPNAPVKLYRENAQSGLSMQLYEDEYALEHELVSEKIPQQNFEHAEGEPAADASVQQPTAEVSAPQPAAEQPAAAAGSELKAKISTAELLTIIWAAGAALYVGVQLACYINFFRYVSRWASPPKNEATRRIFESCTRKMCAGVRLSLAVCSGIESPMVTGFFQTVLLLPREDYSEQELEMIIRHELVHYKRHDIAYKMLLMFAVAVHWFNPLVWIMAQEANKDLELACDEAATAGMNGDERAEYGRALISAAATRNFRPAAFTTCFYEKEGTIKKRIKNLFANGKSRGTATLCIALAAVLTVCALVACGKTEQPETPSYIEELGGESYDLTAFDEAVSLAVNSAGALENSQYTVRAFRIFDTIEHDDFAEVYIYEKCCGFCYVNDVLTLCGDEEGFVKLSFKKEPAGGEKTAYIFDKREAVGGEKLPFEAPSTPDESLDAELFTEIKAKATAYGGTVLFEKPELDYLPISAAAAELLRKANPDYPNWIGSIERAFGETTLRFETKWDEKSEGSGTVEFIKTDFAGKEFAHIVYSVNGDRVELVSQISGESKASEDYSSEAQNDAADTPKYVYFSNSEATNNMPSSDAVQGESVLATEETYAQWQSFMESYIMSAPDVISFFAWQPNDLSSSIEITKDDVTNIIGLLATAWRSPDEPPTGNPPTGGSWHIYWKDAAGTQYWASYNGQYMSFTNSGDGSKIAIYTDYEDCGVGDYLWALGFSKTHNAASILKNNSFYGGHKITAIYAVDEENAAFVQVADSDFALAEVWLKNVIMQRSYHDESEKSFLIVTEGGKSVVWLEETAPKYVSALWESTVQTGTKLARWLAYMSPGKAESIVYEGRISPKNEDGFKNVGWDSAKAAEEYGKDKVAAEVLKAAEYLQKNAVIKKSVSKPDGLTEDGLGWAMTINFTTGVYYKLEYSKSYLEIYTSDLDRTIYYEVSPSFGKGVAKLIYSLETAEKNPYTG